MATRNIARTAIEGGRTASNTWRRRQSNRQVRHEERMRLRMLVREEDREDSLMPHRSQVEKEHADRLSVPTKWLIHHGLGKTPPEIAGMLLSAFDTRTLPGRHIVFSHLMGDLKLRSFPEHIVAGVYVFIFKSWRVEYGDIRLHGEWYDFPESNGFRLRRLERPY